MKISIKIFLSFAAMIAILFTLTLISYNHTKQSQSGYQEMKDDGEFRYSLKALQFRLAGMSNDERAYLLNGDAQFTVEIADKEKQVRQLLIAIKSNRTLDAADLALLGVLSRFKLQ